MKTQQGNFEQRYHHIEAPTVADEKWGKEHKQRKLIIPNEWSLEDAYRSPELFYLRNAEWSYKRKLDGENLRVWWNGEQALWNGKTNSFVCGAELTDYMNSTFLEEIFEEKFGRDKDVYLFGEHMGHKVQGNELGLDNKEFVLFDVKIGNTWLDKESLIDIAKVFNVHTCYDFMALFCADASLDTLIKWCSERVFKDWEGIVAQPLVGLKDRKGNRIIVKIKNKDYLR